MEPTTVSDLTPNAPGNPALYTAEQYLRLVEDGLLTEDDRVELLEGVVVAMTPTNAPHDDAVTQLQYALMRALETRALVRVQCTLRLGGRSVPEPDLAVVRGRPGDYRRAHPTAALLVVEVSDATLRMDRLSKARIYAAAGIPEYWILNLRENVLEVHTGPDRESARYRSIRVCSGDEHVILVAFPDVVLPVAELLPDPEA